MRVMGISNRGLLVITLLVMCLWGIIFAERAIVRQAQREHQEFFRSRPISVPIRPSPGTPQRATPGRRPQSSDAINSSPVVSFKLQERENRYGYSVRLRCASRL
jgi:hypothetical protein